MPPESRLSRQMCRALNATLLVAAKVYQALNEWIRLPFPLPPVEKLAPNLDAKMMTLVEQAVEEIIHQLTIVIDGLAHFPSVLGLPSKQTLPVISEAISQGHKLEMSYWSAGRNVRTERIVHPYRIEWHNQVAYLIAYCQLADDERTFRVDRIERLEILE